MLRTRFLKGLASCIEREIICLIKYEEITLFIDLSLSYLLH